MMEVMSMAKLMTHYRITIDLSEEYGQKLQAIMDQEHLNQTAVLRKALSEYYDRHIQPNP